MKVRIRKKLRQRLGRMHYCDARLAKIVQYVRQTYPNTNLIVYETSKCGRIKKIYAAQGAYPSSTGPTIYKKS